jgi:endoglucanase
MSNKYLTLLLLTIFCCTDVYATPIYRGFTVVPSLSEDNVDSLVKWNVNLINCQLHSPNAAKMNAGEYEDWIVKEFQNIDQLLKKLSNTRIKIIISLLSTPGGFENEKLSWHKIFAQSWAHNSLVNTWNLIATKYKNNKQIIGYLIVSEPGQNRLTPRILSWNNLAKKVALNIRRIDQDKAIILQSVHGDPFKLNKMDILPVKNVWYSFNMYYPHQLTHQGLYNYPMKEKYPNKEFNKKKIYRVLDIGREFQLKHKVQIFIAEFSIVRWAPGGLNYLQDVSNYFEKQNWNWSYHSFLETPNMWSLEFGNNMQDNQKLFQTSDRLAFIQSLLIKNL